jgi:hypothetical protein
MRERDEGAAGIGDGEPRKKPAGGGQRLFASVTVDHTEVRPTIEEHTLAAIRPLEHRRSIIG